MFLEFSQVVLLQYVHHNVAQIVKIVLILEIVFIVLPHIHFHKYHQVKFVCYVNIHVLIVSKLILDFVIIVDHHFQLLHQMEYVIDVIKIVVCNVLLLLKIFVIHVEIDIFY